MHEHVISNNIDYFTLLSKASKEGKDIGMYLVRLILECNFMV